MRVKFLLATLVLVSVPSYASETIKKYGMAKYPLHVSEFRNRINSSVLETCNESRESYNLDYKSCIEVIENKIYSCSRAIVLPEFFENAEQVNVVGRSYLNCVTPYYFCNGIEYSIYEKRPEKCE